jgi:hypothetical protein
MRSTYTASGRVAHPSTRRSTCRRVGTHQAERQLGCITFKQLGDDWVSGKLHEQWPDHVKLKKDIENDKSRLSKLNEVIGDVPIGKFALADAERAMASLPKRLTPATRRRYGQLISRILRMAVYPLKLREHNPLPFGFLPSGTKDSAPEAAVFGVLNKDQAAKVFREHLRIAGVNRVELFECNRNRRPIRLHDLRASFVTLSLASGRTESWVAVRNRSSF